ncbi:glutathione S-transferas-like protein [Plenodomus tracheiphilus IPT5]|uniref:Glutathione S-transferas-like protein n=1 Tax=Plenodomus tracheiphilus IPT5 TaxID=1408161 RepID=A0A6A7BNF3_9PLEO|nr:glutathione S-transferas-like protein [Plenodomus tracheiphilus IPT5]
MSSTDVIFYDLANKQGTCWSLNPWKTRMILNYKSIPYTTQWVEYPDLTPTLSALGIPPIPKTAPGYSADYTSPAIRYANGTYAMDSWPIAHDLEAQYPEPPLHLDDPVVIQVRDLIGDFFTPLRAHLLPRVPYLLPERSAEYFYRTRKVRFGKSLQQVGSEAGEKNWEDAKNPAKVTGDLLRKNGGPFFLGETVSYADFIFVSALQCFKRVDEGMFKRLMGLDPAFEKMYEASKQWLENAD